MSRQDLVSLVEFCCYTEAGEEKRVKQGVYYGRTVWFAILKVLIKEHMFKHHVTEENIFETTILERRRNASAIWLKDTSSLPLEELEKSLRYDVETIAAADYIKTLRQQKSYRLVDHMRKGEIRSLAAWINNNSLRVLLNRVYKNVEDGQLSGDEIFRECYIRTTKAYRALVYLRDMYPYLKIKVFKDIAENELYENSLCIFLEDWLKNKLTSENEWTRERAYNGSPYPV